MCILHCSVTLHTYIFIWSFQNYVKLPEFQTTCVTETVELRIGIMNSIKE